MLTSTSAKENLLVYFSFNNSDDFAIYEVVKDYFIEVTRSEDAEYIIYSVAGDERAKFDVENLDVNLKRNESRVDSENYVENGFEVIGNKRVYTAKLRKIDMKRHGIVLHYLSFLTGYKNNDKTSIIDFVTRQFRII